MKLTDRQKHLLRACVEGELEMNDQGDTALSIEAAGDDEEVNDDDAAKAVEKLQEELRELLTILA